MPKLTGVIDDLDPSDTQTLSKVNIPTEGLPKVAGNMKSPQQLAIQLGLAEMAMLKWINMGDLSRIKNLTSHHIELLEAASVNTVQELRICQAENLARKLINVNEANRVVRQLPTLQQLREWIAQAKRLEPAAAH